MVVVKVVRPPSNPQDEAQTQTQIQTQQAIWDHLRKNVQGTPAALTDAELSQVTDWSKVRKYYRLNSVPALDRLADEKERRKQSESLAIMGMALRGL